MHFLSASELDRGRAGEGRRPKAVAAAAPGVKPRHASENSVTVQKKPAPLAHAFRESN